MRFHRTLSTLSLRRFLHYRSAAILPLLFGVLLAVSCSDDDGPVDPPATGLSEIEQRVHDLVNEHRENEDLPKLDVLNVITEQARNHSQGMADMTVPFGHQGFNDRVDAIKASMNLASAGENVAFNQGYSDPAKAAFDGWLASQGHKENIEGDWTHTGIGVVKNNKGAYYFTQIFVREKE